MTPQLIALLASIYATQARIEGMTAENALRQAGGNSPAYGDQDFFTEAHQLEIFADQARSLTS